MNLSEKLAAADGEDAPSAGGGRRLATAGPPMAPPPAERA